MEGQTNGKGVIAVKNEKTREQVMQGLELHAHCAHECDKCPYDDQRRRWMRGEGASCDSFLAADALRVIDEMDVTIRAMMGEFGDSCDAEGCGAGED